MNSVDIVSFLNGLVCGGSISLFLISLFFLTIVKPIEGINGLTTTEIRFAILISGIAIVLTIAYEMHRKKDGEKSQI